MANLNKVMFIGRLTRDPEIRSFSNGGKVAAFGFAVNNRKKDTASGQWVDEPVFIDVKVFNRGESGRQADLVEQSLHKGNQVFLEGHLVMETWDDKNGGGKRSKLVVVVDNFQFLERREDGGGGGSAPARSFQQRGPALSNRMSAPPADDYDSDPAYEAPSKSGPPDEEIPF